MKSCRSMFGGVSFTFVIVSLLLTSCMIRPRLNEKAESVARSTERTDPATSAAELQKNTHELPDYRLGFSDVIDIKFFSDSEFNETLTVRPDGKISMQRVGDIKVAGMTPAELSKVIAETYSSIIKNPEVTVIVRSFGGYQVYVLGEVNSPGDFPIQRNLTVLQSIAQAGGQKESANMKSVLVMRRDENGGVTATRVDLSGLSSEMIQKNDIFVEAYDIIYVPKTYIANINTFVDQALSGIIKPLDIYMRVAWFYK
jgi:polysaccharide export outer membrane protein